MRKRYFITIISAVIIFTGIILALTNSILLWAKPVDVAFNVNGNQDVKIEVALDGTKGKEQKIDLEKDNQLKFEISKKGYFKTLKIVINTDLQAKSGGVVQLSDISLKQEKIKIDDLSKIKVFGANYEISNDELVLSPTSKKIVLECPVSGHFMFGLEWLLFFLILLLAFAHQYSNLRPYLDVLKRYVNKNKKIILSSCILSVIFTCLTPHLWVNSEYWRNKFPQPAYHGMTIEFENVNNLEPIVKNGDGFSYCVDEKNILIALFKPFRNVEMTENWATDFNIDADANLRISQNFKPSKLKINNIDETDNIVGDILPIKKGRIYNIELSGKYMTNKIPLKKSINYISFALSWLFYFFAFAFCGKFFEKNKFLKCLKENKTSVILFLLFFATYFMSNNYFIYHTNYFFDYDVFMTADSNLLVQNVLHSTQTRFHPYFFIMFYPIFDILFWFTKNVTLILRLLYCSISAVTVVFTYKSIKSLMSQSKILPILLTLIFGFAFAPLVMTYAFDVYPISAMYLSLLIYFTIKELNNTEENLKNLIIIAIICALSFGVSTINLITNLVILNSIFLKKRKSKDLLFVLLIFAVATCFFLALQNIPCSEIFKTIFSSNLNEELGRWFLNVPFVVFFEESFIMPMIGQDCLLADFTMVSFWVIFIDLAIFGAIFMKNNENKFSGFYFSSLIALVLNFVFVHIWAPSEGFLFALNSFELWFIVLSLNILVAISVFKSKEKVIKYLLVALLSILLFIEIPLNCVANKDVQINTVKKCPLTYPIIEENHRE